MESITGTSGNNLLIGGIAIEPNVVQGKDPTVIAPEDQQALSTSSMDEEPTRNPPLPVQPVAQPETVSHSTATLTSSPAKKPRGRPRKVPAQVTRPESEAATPPAAKRGRGRPRKTTQGSNGVVKKPVTVPAERDGPSITDTDYNPSCIDKLMEDMISKKKPAEQSKRPVGRPRKRPLDGKQPVKAKKFKGEMSIGSVPEGKRSTVLDNLFAIMPQDEPADHPLSMAAKVNSEPSKLQISKEMVDKMIGKMKSGQGSEAAVSPDIVHKPTSPNADQAQPQKRRRGRPKKGEEKMKPLASDSSPIKRSRGRPKKSLSSAAEVESKEDSPVKKKRGRPKKVTLTEAKPTIADVENGEKPTAKRKRGRPRKVDAPAQVATKEQASSASEGTVSVQPSHSAVEEPTVQQAEGNANSGVEIEDSEQEVMGKLQVSFSESESEGSDPMDATIDALTHRVAPPPKPTPQQNNSPLFVDNQFEESFDEDSDN